MISNCIESEGGSLRWLDGADEMDHEIWRNVWENSCVRRPYDHPDFLQVMEPAGFTPAAAIYNNANGALVLYTFYWRALNSLPFFIGYTSPFIHLISPYGYGGPIYEGLPEHRLKVSREFETWFTAEAASRGTVSEFVREDLFQERLVVRNQGEHFAQQPNVVVRLERDSDQIWREYLPKVRKNVNRARQHGLRVVFDDSGKYFDAFHAIYHVTMERTGAAASFFIEKEKFELLGRTLGAAGGLTYVHVFDGDQIISTELLLLSSDTIYSFLGGTLAAAFDKRPNDLLKHEVIVWGKGQGYKYYVLGGGIISKDGIFSYKKAFDPEGIYPFYVRRILHDKEKYQLLVEERRKYELEQGRVWQPREDYFPAYLS